MYWPMTAPTWALVPADPLFITEVEDDALDLPIIQTNIKHLLYIYIYIYIDRNTKHLPEDVDSFVDEDWEDCADWLFVKLLVADVTAVSY